MKIKLTANDAQEVAHKIGALAETPDLQDDYGMTQQQADELRASVPLHGGEWCVPQWAIEAVRGEMENHCDVLRGIADDARSSSEAGQALQICKQAKRLSEAFAEQGGYPSP